MNYQRKYYEAIGTLIAVAVIAICLLFSGKCRAELVTEFGGGISFAGSPLGDSRCRDALLQDADGSLKFDGLGRVRTVNCGGHDPVFIGWPLAWEFPNGTRLGWFHKSNWLDGPPFNHNPELTFNCLCSTWTHHWRRK